MLSFCLLCCIVPSTLLGWEAVGVRLMERSVTESSAQTYMVGWNAWSKFTSSCGIDPYLRAPPASWGSSNHLLDFEPAIVAAFCAYSSIQCLLSPNTVDNYLAGVSYCLRLNNIDVAFMSAPAVLMAKTGMRHIYEASRERKRKTLPFTLDMILRYISSVDVSLLSSMGMLTSLLLAHFNFLRVSEYVESKLNHFMRCMDVEFIGYDGSVYGCLSLKGIPLSVIARVTFLIRSSKTDSEKRGCTNYFDKRASGVCICSTAYAWAIKANFPRGDVAFLSTYSLSGVLLWKVNAKEVSVVLKSVAVFFGFRDLSGFTPHSLRYGAASALAAAGIDEYTIKLLGRWRSDAFLQYIKLSSLMLETACSALSDPLVMCAADVLLL